MHARHLCRYYCRDSNADSLAKLYKACMWQDRNRVCEYYALVADWPEQRMSVVGALQLLDASVADVVTRRLAVRVLDARFNDDELLLYLLQLVQVSLPAGSTPNALFSSPPRLLPFASPRPDPLLGFHLQKRHM